MLIMDLDAQYTVLAADTQILSFGGNSNNTIFGLFCLVF